MITTLFKIKFSIYVIMSPNYHLVPKQARIGEVLKAEKIIINLLMGKLD